MNIRELTKNLIHCPCGRAHTVQVRAIEIGHGVKERSAALLRAHHFPTRILAVADQNTLSASSGILEILRDGGFDLKLLCYENFRTPLVEYVNEVAEAAKDREGILSIGTGSLNDICRRASFLQNKAFAIFATAPSMDGFASGSAPIIENGIKESLEARSPSVILADSAILAAAPAELKASGFGDILGKYIGLVDWRVSHLLTGEYYCDRIASLVRTALGRVASMADRVTVADEETAGFLMESLILTGLAMQLANCTRPASGAEHQISHFIGMRKLAEGKMADYHGKKVGVATVALARAYRRLAEGKQVVFCPEKIDLEEIKSAYVPASHPFIQAQNCPPITEGMTPEQLAACWEEICRIIREELPSEETLLDTMKRAGAASSFDEIDTDDALRDQALRYHSFMRHKIVLTRLLYMTDADIVSLCT